MDAEDIEVLPDEDEHEDGDRDVDGEAGLVDDEKAWGQ